MTAGNGKPCIRCGTSEWNTWNSCKECARRCASLWKAEHPEQKKNNDRNWQKNNPDKVKIRNDKWKLNNKEKFLSILRTSCRNWRKNNSEKQHTACSQWKKNNPERNSISENKRRAQKTNSQESFTYQEWIDLCDRFDNKCLACGQGNIKLTQDHVIPLSRGGSNSINNIQPLCKSCNCKKHTQIFDYRIGGTK